MPTTTTTMPPTTTPPTIAELNASARRVAQELHERFPDVPDECIGKWAKFVVAAGTALRACEDRLAADGKQLNAKGLDYVLGEVAGHVFGE